MWCVMQVWAGTEESVKHKCDQTFLRNIDHIFILTYERKRRYEDAWNMERKMLFPGCQFVITDELAVRYLSQADHLRVLKTAYTA